MRSFTTVLLSIVVGTAAMSAQADRTALEATSWATADASALSGAKARLPELSPESSYSLGTLSAKAKRGYAYGLESPRRVARALDVSKAEGSKTLTAHRSTGILYCDTVAIEKFADDSLLIKSFIFDEISIKARYDAATGAVAIPCQHVIDITEGPISLCSVDFDRSVYSMTDDIEGSIDADGNISLVTGFGFFVTEGDYKGASLTVGLMNYADIFIPNATITTKVINYSSSPFTTDGRSVSTVSDWVYVNQIGDNTVRLSHLITSVGYGDVTLRMTAAKTFEIDPQQVVYLSPYGFFNFYKLTETVAADGSVTVSASLLSPSEASYADGKISIGKWMLASTGGGVLNLFESSVIAIDKAFSFPAAPAFSMEGEGTEASPYLIKSIEDLRTIAACVNGGVAKRTVHGSGDDAYYTVYDGTYFRLADDIDASAAAGQLEPIGGNTLRFAGVLDGNGKTIAKLAIRDYAYDYCGLFGAIAEGGAVSNLTFDTPRITTLGYNAGVVCGYNYGTIEGVSVVSGTVQAAAGYNAGGIAAKSDGTISNCSASCNVTALGYIGGIAGRNGGDIIGCSASGTMQMTGKEVFGGGIVGYSSGINKAANAKVQGCYFSGLVYAANNEVAVGGIAGSIANTDMTECFATARVVGVSSNAVYVGGLTGTVYKSTVANCYAAGFVEGAATTNCGGLTGKSSEYYSSGDAEIVGTTFTDCYSAAMLSTKSDDEMRGLVGNPQYITMTNCYYDAQIAGVANATYGLDTEAMTAAAGLPGFSAAAWTAAEATYPNLKRFADNPVAAVATAAVKLAKGETLAQVKSDFTYKAISDAVEWKAYVGKQYSAEGGHAFVFDNGVARLNYNQTTDTIFAIGATASKYFIANVAPMPFKGDGTAESPWEIGTKEELRQFSAISNDANVTYAGYFLKQVADIDCEGDTIAPICTDNAGKHQFLGTYDGGGYRISNLVVTTVEFYEEGNSAGKPAGEVNPKGDKSINYGGLFGNIGAEGTVRNVTIDRSCLFDVFSYGGAIAGSCEGTVEGCRNYAPVTVYFSNAGGIVGTLKAGGVVADCYNEGKVTAGYYIAGGIVGTATSATVSGCVNAGEVTAEYINSYQAEGKQYRAGGIVGDNAKSQIVNVLNVGKVSSLKGVGGIAANMSGTAAAPASIVGAVNYGIVESGELASTGQVAGANSLGTIADCYIDAQLTKAGAVGGGAATGVTALLTRELTAGKLTLNQEAWSQAEGRYPMIAAFQAEPMLKLAAEAALLVGDSEFASAIRSNATLANGATVAWSLKSGAAFKIEGSALVPTVPQSGVVADTLVAASADVSRLVPIATLNADIFDGDGTAASPYLINSADDFLALGSFVESTGYDYANEYFKVTANLDFADKAFKPVGYGTCIFSGIFDGNGMTISNIAYDESADKTATYRGLFGVVGSSGYVGNLTLDATNSIKAYQYVGGIAGSLYGTIYGCDNYATVDAAGSTGAAGIAANANAGARIVKCSNAGTITAKSGVVAGILANSPASAAVEVDSCKNVAEISSTTKVAGIVASVSAIVTNCENSGVISGSSTIVGGIVGSALVPSAIRKCSNSANLVASQYVGGIVGQTTAHTGDIYMVIDSCYNTADIDGAATEKAKGYVGGIGGDIKNGTHITNCYNTGRIATQYTSSTSYIRAGGLVGTISGALAAKTYISDCYNAGSYVWGNNSVGGIAGYISGDSTVYVTRVYNLADIEAVATSNAYAGGISGNGSCRLTDSWNAGNVIAVGSNVGGLIGYSSSKPFQFERNFNVGAVTATTAKGLQVGGLVGQGRPKMVDCYNFGEVSGYNNVGGLLGYPGNAQATTYWVTLANSYCAAKVTATNGSNAGNVAAINANCKYLTITGCYYDASLSDALGCDASYNTSEEYDTRDGIVALGHAELCSLDMGDAFDNGVATYPSLKVHADNPVNSFYVASLVLADGDDLASVSKPFAIGTPKGVAWTASDNLAIDGNDVQLRNLTAGESATLTLTAGELTRTYELTIVSAYSGIDDASLAGKQVARRDYYGLDGLKLTAPGEGAGIVVEKVTFTDGTTATRKLLLRRR